MIASMAAVSILRTGNQLGEGVLWSRRESALYWTDIETATLWRYFPVTAAVQRWCLPERLACIALCASDGWLLLGLSKRLALFNIASNRLIPLMDVEAELPTRLNDGACDREGRFVFGTMDENSPPQEIGGFYRLHSDFRLERLPLSSVAISNSLAFSPDGRILYFCDSKNRKILCCDYSSDGQVGTPRLFVDLGRLQGVPDGAAVDAEGYIWSAQWGMSRVTRYRPDGTEDMHIDVPASQPTRVAFGGTELQTLFITSARQGLTSAILQQEKFAGDLFAVDPGPRGVGEAPFAGDPELAAKLYKPYDLMKSEIFR